MSQPKLRLDTATATHAVLAKIGNPQRDEPLETSRDVFEIAEKDQELLTALFLKPFKNLPPNRFAHHSSLEQHEMNSCVRTIFEDESTLLTKGIEIAQRLYAKSNHPNIKAGDLCITLLKEAHIEGELVSALCILKSDCVSPFLTISARNGDLRLATEQGINPDKIDKGCLVLNYWSNKGYYVLTFDRGGGDTRFWVREFLGVEAVADAAFLTNAYAKMAVSFIGDQKAAPNGSEEDEESGPPPWEPATAAQEALDYFQGRERFELEDFEREVLKTPESIAMFQEHRARAEEEQGQALATSFDISQKDVTKARKRISAVLKLDTGVEIHVKPASGSEQPVLERGYDSRKGMKFIKVYYNKDLSAE